MSHFTVLVVLPKEGLERYENANENTGEDEYRNAYNHQWYHPQLESALAPYNEQPEDDSDYLERDIQLNETATGVWRAFVDREWTLLANLHNERREVIENWERNSTVWDIEGGRKRTEDEIATRLKPIDSLYELMASEKFDFFNDEHKELFIQIYGDSSEMMLDKENREVFDVWYSNPYAKWDWWVVGGRWRNMGDNGLFEDISVFSKEKEIPYWKEELGFKLHEIERELGIQDKDLSQEEYDEYITDYIASGNPIVRFYDRDTKEPKEYYDKKDLLTMVKRKEESTWAMLFPEEGWIEAGEMGWFGISSLDSLDIQETEEAKNDQFALTDNLIEKYKDTHIGLVVDCHI